MPWHAMAPNLWSLKRECWLSLRPFCLPCFLSEKLIGYSKQIRTQPETAACHRTKLATKRGQEMGQIIKRVTQKLNIMSSSPRAHCHTITTITEETATATTLNPENVCVTRNGEPGRWLSVSDPPSIHTAIDRHRNIGWMVTDRNPFGRWNTDALEWSVACMTGGGWTRWQNKPRTFCLASFLHHVAIPYSVCASFPIAEYDYSTTCVSVDTIIPHRGDFSYPVGLHIKSSDVGLPMLSLLSHFH